MTFNDDAKLSGRGVRKSGRRTGIAVGGGGLGLVALFLISQFLGVDLTSLAGGDGSSAPSEDTALTGCYTGEDANANVECRVQGAYDSLDDYWEDQAPALGVAYHRVVRQRG